MPSKKRKYNARFPAGRIKKIMQTDEEVGKVAQAVPIIIFVHMWNELPPEVFSEHYDMGFFKKVQKELSFKAGDALATPLVSQMSIGDGGYFPSASPRTLELFVESLLSKAMQVTLSRNAKTLSPSHVKQCILAESRFDFLRDLVKNIPDVSVAEEKEMMSAESSPNSSRYSDTSAPPRRIAREDSNSSSSSDIRVQQVPRDLKRAHSAETTPAPGPVGDVAIDLTTRPEDKPVRTANFYQETLVTDEVQHHSVITLNPSYATPQPSTSSYGAPELKKVVPVPKELKVYRNMSRSPPRSPMTPITPGTPGTPNPILNIDFSKNFGKPEIKVLDTAVAGIVGKNEKKLQRQNSKPQKPEKRPEPKPVALDIDHLNSGNLQIDEDYDT